MAKPYCRCGHRKSKHKYEYSGYPIDAPTCAGKNLPNHDPDNCRCEEYNPLSNLEFLERRYIMSLGKNVKGRKV